MLIYYIRINENDDSGMDAISLVDYPAVQKNFLCFNKEEQKKLIFNNESKQTITGVVALADTPIYRYNPGIGEYYVVFSADTIRKMIEKYSKNGLFNSVNLDHNDERFVDKVYMLESYIVDKQRGICPEEFKDIPDGSWICTFKIADKNLWSEIVNTDKYNGFSLQGMFDLSPEQFKEANNPVNPIDEIIDELLGSIDNQK